MRVKHFGSGFFLVVFIALLADFLFTACASRGNPDGGPRDTLAPAVDTTFPPNFSTGFKSNEIEILFNEYISLKSANQQIRITPPLSESLEIKAGTKSILIEIPADSLLPNTTYTISFGTAITDYTEGNVNDAFKYVFSTGTFIDSLSISGSVRDVENEPQEEILVALYELSTLQIADSIPFKALPTYYTYTDENGKFELTNLKYGRFHVLAFEDAGGKFKMLTGNETVAFLNDTLALKAENPNLELIAFKPEGRARFISARHVGPNQIRLVFSGNTEKVNISRLNAPEGKKAVDDYVEFTGTDTLYYWFQAGTDSIGLVINNPGAYTDTTQVKLREYPEKTLRLSLDEKELAPGDSLHLKSNIPLLSLNKNNFMVTTAKDTLTTLDLSLGSRNKKRLSLARPPNAENSKLVIYPGGVLPFSGTQKDSAGFSYSVLKREDLGNALFTVVADSAHQYILNIFKPNGDVLLTRTFTGTVQLNLRNLHPEKYKAQLIIDKDKNERWSSGNYFEGLQPERIINYTDALEIRANWDLEIDWILGKDQLKSSN